MDEYYENYIWRNGIPYGVSKQQNTTGRLYKIPMDPYRKRIAIELYNEGKFCQQVYDSALLDFRFLKSSAEYMAWQKTVVSSTPAKVISHLRNQDDRLVCVETCFFSGKYCMECTISSPQGIILSIHKMFYRALKNPMNGVILYDSNEHPIMIKKYSIDEETGEFTDLLEERWEMDAPTVACSSPY